MYLTTISSILYKKSIGISRTIYTKSFTSFIFNWKWEYKRYSCRSSKRDFKYFDIYWTIMSLFINPKKCCSWIYTTLYFWCFEILQCEVIVLTIELMSTSCMISDDNNMGNWDIADHDVVYSNCNFFEFDEKSLTLLLNSMVY